MRTRAWLRFKQDLVKARKQNFRAPNPAPRLAAINAAPEQDDEVKHVASKKQKAAARRNIKKAQAALRKKKRGGKKRRRSKSKRRKAVATTGYMSSAGPAPKRRRRRKKAAKAAAPKRRRRRSSKKRRRSSKRRGSSRRAVKTIRQRVVSVPKAGTQSVRIDLAASRGGKKRRRRSRRRNPETSLTRTSNPQGLMSNAGPFTRDALMGYVAAAGGVGLGVIGADFLDRFIATRTPSEGFHPWYGRASAAAYNRRPDAMRLGAQAGGAVAAMALTYFARNIKVLPWALGGLSVGFGVNLLKMLSDWYLMPAILKVDSPNEISFANRMFPMEQAGVQDEVDKLFENYNATPGLMGGQPATGEPVVSSPLGVLEGGHVYVLGSGDPGAGDVGRTSQRRFIKTGKLGGCSGCGGNDGCYSDCPNMCNECIQGGDGSGTYTVQPGDNYSQIIPAANVDANVVMGLNGGRHWQEFWRPGAKVQVPYALGVYLQNMIKHKAALAGVPGQQQVPPMPVPQPVPVPQAIVQDNGSAPSPQPLSSAGLFNDAE